MPFGINENAFKQINKVFTTFPVVQKVLLYGSRAKGNYRAGSDIDLAIKGNDINLQLLNKIRLQLDDLMLPYSFDISNYQQIENPELISHIDRVGKVFFSINLD
jgi:predicted nucleotidyltransferase